jgi:uncharacterized phage-associated protein
VTLTSANSSAVEEHLPIDGRDLANYILDVADGEGISVSNLALQKILFFCHANHLVHFGRPLIHSQFLAWGLGPVILSVYEVFKPFDSAPITARAVQFDKLERRFFVKRFSPSGDLESFLRSVILGYGRLSASALVKLSHEHNGPWDIALRAYREGANFGKTISDSLITANFYPPRDIGELST